ncbi:hypothetical protein DQG23_23160 [Paenibacillus contaminans]|uniref:Uncharacterized protein n=1 Tax=Paenibacillus contaminans TaxID=450362 RepID=A0A329MH77_9BACL|nr:hypothetical protein DQG23_23160 [Paenibacillus contaminans]
MLGCTGIGSRNGTEEGTVKSNFGPAGVGVGVGVGVDVGGGELPLGDGVGDAGPYVTSIEFGYK